MHQPAGAEGVEMGRELRVPSVEAEVVAPNRVEGGEHDAGRRLAAGEERQRHSRQSSPRARHAATRGTRARARPRARTPSAAVSDAVPALARLEDPRQEGFELRRASSGSARYSGGRPSGPSFATRGGRGRSSPPVIWSGVPGASGGGPGRSRSTRPRWRPAPGARPPVSGAAPLLRGAQRERLPLEGLRDGKTGGAQQCGRHVHAAHRAGRDPRRAGLGRAHEQRHPDLVHPHRVAVGEVVAVLAEGLGVIRGEHHPGPRPERIRSRHQPSHVQVHVADLVPIALFVGLQTAEARERLVGRDSLIAGVVVQPGGGGASGGSRRRGACGGGRARGDPGSGPRGTRGAAPPAARPAPRR